MSRGAAGREPPGPGAGAASEMRLSRYLALAGVAARRRAEALIVEGRVRVNGRVVDQLGARIDPNARVTVDGRPVQLGETHHLLVCKPRGRASAAVDPEGRPTVRELLPRDLGTLHAAGRLDFNAEGALLMTTDGRLVEALSRAVPPPGERYHVKVRGEVTEAELGRLRRGGLPVGRGEVSPPARARRLAFTGKHTWLEVELADGRPRILQRTIEALGHMTIKVARLAYAGLEVGELRPGEYRSLSTREVEQLWKLGSPPGGRLAAGAPRPPSPRAPARKRAGRAHAPRAEARADTTGLPRRDTRQGGRSETRGGGRTHVRGPATPDTRGGTRTPGRGESPPGVRTGGPRGRGGRGR